MYLANSKNEHLISTRTPRSWVVDMDTPNHSLLGLCTYTPRQEGPGISLYYTSTWSLKVPWKIGTSTCF